MRLSTPELGFGAAGLVGGAVSSGAFGVSGLDLGETSFSCLLKAVLFDSEEGMDAELSVFATDSELFGETGAVGATGSIGETEELFDGGSTPEADALGVLFSKSFCGGLKVESALLDFGGFGLLRISNICGLLGAEAPLPEPLLFVPCLDNPKAVSFSACERIRSASDSVIVLL